ncbi:MAG TPA: Ku protein [Chryseolinea sp.]|nr:Ku protein [Chryseolinea sp.]
MARSIWKGSITFGLVSIPVELFPAEDRKEFQLSMLDRRDFSPVGYKRYSKTSGKEVEWKGIVKGYEYEKDQYVVLSDEDFKRANVKATRTVEIQTFVQDGDISPEFFDAPYYLVPADRGEKIYALLRETLRSTERVGIAQFVMRSKQHLAAIKPVGRALMLFTLRYANELHGTSGFGLPAAGLKEARVTTKEIELAKRLIDDMTDKWNPASFVDTYHEDLMKRIKEKIKKGQTQEITKPSDDDDEAPRASNVIDLASLLKKSIDGGGHKSKTTAKRSLRLVHDSRNQPKRKRA